MNKEDCLQLVLNKKELFLIHVLFAKITQDKLDFSDYLDEIIKFNSEISKRILPITDEAWEDYEYIQRSLEEYKEIE
jgi:hypothetical protein